MNIEKLNRYLASVGDPPADVYVMVKHHRMLDAIEYAEDDFEGDPVVWLCQNHCVKNCSACTQLSCCDKALVLPANTDC